MLINANVGANRPAVPVALVAVGAMLVGSIGWSKKPGDKVAKGEELGWFQVRSVFLAELTIVWWIDLYHCFP